MNKVIYAMIAGFTLGVLLAPDRGSETRKKLKNRYRKLAEDLTGNNARMFERAKALANDVKEGIHDGKKEFNGLADASMG